MQTSFNPKIAAMSSYLAFRYIAYNNAKFTENAIVPSFDSSCTEMFEINNAIDIDRAIHIMLDKCDWRNTGILLSGGMDSAILASFVPNGTKAYTIRFIADNAIDESILSRKYADHYNLDLRVVDVCFDDYLVYAPLLMYNRKCPLHQIECAIFKAAKQAKFDGLNALITGNGADYLFGGLDKLYLRDWGFFEFIERYTYVQPNQVLKNYHNIEDIYETYRIHKSKIDVSGFLKDIFGLCTMIGFRNPLSATKITPIEPYEQMKLGITLNMERIRNGESKYLIRELFSRKYPEFPQPNKIAFKRPMDQWLSDYIGPNRPEFIKNCTKTMTGEQKWLVFCLEWFLNLLDCDEI